MGFPHAHTTGSHANPFRGVPKEAGRISPDYDAQSLGTFEKLSLRECGAWVNDVNPHRQEKEAGDPFGSPSSPPGLSICHSPSEHIFEVPTGLNRLPLPPSMLSDAVVSTDLGPDVLETAQHPQSFHLSETDNVSLWDDSEEIFNFQLDELPHSIYGSYGDIGVNELASKESASGRDLLREKDTSNIAPDLFIAASKIIPTMTPTYRPSSGRTPTYTDGFQNCAGRPRKSQPTSAAANLGQSSANTVGAGGTKRPSGQAPDDVNDSNDEDNKPRKTRKANADVTKLKGERYGCIFPKHYPSEHRDCWNWS
ncbi:uncharacterized protein K460DRAFT_399937 [Cucurbitaria berberidis CBS 394.84]|uniref:Uncharacterized protein n=1 Tax=Cucurbitaria berberidis CBS 394.84 TaxID=1168544 RepID=A0A9P4GNP0_9PLEO|nr:uncharacterized protein K460DRAFT_399937 [Cucurbitaria berberidis CBS 394.84]KAF1849828.1 hypothetical protein K460DRAFT_399937 [Cucurbitaria berberidis CBS 394.84]